MTEAPTAPVIWRGGSEVVITCPYCRGQHRHKIGGDSKKGQPTRRAPGCGVTATPTQRATGYWITLTDQATTTRKA